VHPPVPAGPATLTYIHGRVRAGEPGEPPLNLSAPATCNIPTAARVQVSRGFGFDSRLRWPARRGHPTPAAV